MTDIHTVLRRVASPLNLDMIERLAILTFYIFVFQRLMPSLADGRMANWLILISEGTVVFFVLIRKPAQTISQRPTDWILGFVGTVAPLMIAPGGDALIAQVTAGWLMLAGILFQLTAKLCLNRSFGVVAANRGVKLGGPYSLMRHPIYLGYIVTQIGFLLANPTWWNGAVYAVAISINIARLLVEERVLRHDEAYRAYALRVRYRLIPGVF